MGARRLDYVALLFSTEILKPEKWQPAFDILSIAAGAPWSFVALYTETGYLLISSASDSCVELDDELGFDKFVDKDRIETLSLGSLPLSLGWETTEGDLLVTPIIDQLGCLYGVIGMQLLEAAENPQNAEILRCVSELAAGTCRAIQSEIPTKQVDDIERLALISMAEDLDAAQSELSALLDNVPAAVVVTDEVGGIIRGNLQAHAMFGSAEKPLNEMVISDVIVTPISDMAENIARKTLARAQGGSFFPVALAFTSREVGNKVRESTYTITDLSSITEIEAQVSHARAELDRFIEMVRVPILMLDLDGVITGCNTSAAVMLGIDADEAIGEPFHLKFMDEADALEHRPDFDRLDQGEDLNNLQLRVRAADNSYRHVLVSVTVRRDSGGKPLGRIAFGQDVTELRMNENILQQSQKMETLGQLTGGIAHDFNNLLNIISGNLRFLESVFPPDSEEQEVVDDAVSAAEDAGDLINRLLRFSRDDFGSIVRMNISEGISKVVRVTKRVIKAPVELEVLPLDENLDVDVDGIWFESSLLNLLTNARDAMGEKGGSIRVGAESVFVESLPGMNLPRGQYIRVWVEDSGPGVPEAMRNRIFDPFFTTKSSGKGTGLGLSMVYRFCQRSGGYCELDGKYTGGARFVMTLPQAIEQSAIDDVVDQKNKALAGGKPLVLIVEDDERVRRVVVRDFRSMGFDCQQAGSADEALRVLEDNPPVSLVFSDVIMPGSKDGFDLADWIQANRPSLPVLLTSAYVGKDGMRNSAVELVTKPYDVSELERLVMNLVR